MIDKWNEPGNPCPACMSDRPHLTGSADCVTRQWDRERLRNPTTRVDGDLLDAMQQEIATLRRSLDAAKGRVETLEGRLARVLRFAAKAYRAYRTHHPYTDREWSHFTQRGSAWSGRRAGRGTKP